MIIWMAKTGDTYSQQWQDFTHAWLITHRIHVWYIYPHLVYLYGKCR